MTTNSAAAKDILQRNRRDGYTIPSPKLYPYQWNWDSGFIAIGLSEVEPAAAKEELINLFEGMWDSGMLPHILFRNESASGYFPGPEEWDARTAEGLATSGITQPPIAVTAARHVYERTGDTEFLHAVLDSVRNHMSWWVEKRSVDGKLVYVRHPWETGMDDSPAWDAPLSEIDPGSPEYEREDLKDESADRERPPDWYYDRYVYLLRQGHRHDWDETTLREVCPFRVEDILTNTLFLRAAEDLAAMLEAAGLADAATRWHDQAAATRSAAQERLWDDELGTFVSYDQVGDRQLRANSVAGLLSTFAGLPTDTQFDRLLTNLQTNFLTYSFGVPTYVGPEMDTDRYWRGPIWINTNWLLSRGLRAYDTDIAADIRRHSLQLVDEEGFYEYFNPETGAPRGSEAFSWTAALYLDWQRSASQE